MIDHVPSCPHSVCSAMGDCTGLLVSLTPLLSCLSSEALDLWPVLPCICVLYGWVWISIFLDGWMDGWMNECVYVCVNQVGAALLCLEHG